MMKFFTKPTLHLIILSIFITSFASAQTRLAGIIADAATKDGLAGVSLAIKGRVAGTITDAKGRFAFVTTVPKPFTLIISSVGY